MRTGEKNFPSSSFWSSLTPLVQISFFPQLYPYKKNTEQSLAKITPALQATVYVLRRTQLLPPNSDHVMNPLAGCNCIIFKPPAKCTGVGAIRRVVTSQIDHRMTWVGSSNKKVNTLAECVHFTKNLLIIRSVLWNQSYKRPWESQRLKSVFKRTGQTYEYDFYILIKYWIIGWFNSRVFICLAIMGYKPSYHAHARRQLKSKMFLNIPTFRLFLQNKVRKIYLFFEELLIKQLSRSRTLGMR